jgi:hypothetical protein
LDQGEHQEQRQADDGMFIERWSHREAIQKTQPFPHVKFFLHSWRCTQYQASLSAAPNYKYSPHSHLLAFAAGTEFQIHTLPYEAIDSSSHLP